MAEQNLDWLNAHPAVDAPPAATGSSAQPAPAKQTPSADLNWLSAHPAVDAAGGHQASAALPPAAGDAAGAKPEIGAGRSMLRSFNDAITLGTSDEILAGINAGIAPLVGHGDDGATFGERYDKYLAGQRALNQSAREQHPVVAGLGAAVGRWRPWRSLVALPRWPPVLARRP